MPTLLTDGELAGMELQREENMPDVANVVTITYERDKFGDTEEVAMTGPDIPCRVALLGAGERERLVLDRLGVVEAWKLVVEKDSEINLRDRVVIDSAGETRLLELVSKPSPRSYKLAQSWIGIEVT